MQVIHLIQPSDVERLCLELQLTALAASTIAKRFDGFFPITIIHEKDYYDRDWTSMLAEHYSTIFGQFPRVVDRLHVFRGQIDKQDVLFDAGAYQEDYFGFVTVYPCRPRCIGRSLLSAGMFNLKPGVLTCQNTVHLAGAPLEVDAFPFSGQDAKLLSCAHIAIWQVVRYFSTKYGYYGEHYPADIAKACEDPRFGRSVPTDGLRWTQMLTGLHSVRLRPVIYDRSTDLQRRARDYLISGIPVILLGAHASGGHHAVVGIGLENPGDVNSNIIVNDDNYLSYGLMSCTPSNCSIKICDLEYVIAPLYAKIVLPIEAAEKHSEVIESDSQFGLRAHGVQDVDLFKKVFLTSSRTYKCALCHRTPLGVFEVLARTEAFPKFVWIVEYHDRLNPGIVLAEYVLDATTSVHDRKSFILLKYSNRVWKNDRMLGQKDDIVFFDTPKASPWNAFAGKLFQ